MNIKRVTAATVLTVMPLTASSVALVAPAAPQGALTAAIAVPAQVTLEGAQYADTVLNKASGLRSNLDLQPVTRYQELNAVARDWSERQTATNNMSHRPDFTSAYPSGWTIGSKNVARRTAGSDIGAQIFNQWLDPPGYYKNVTDPSVNSVGIGFAQTSDGKWYVTQNFAAYNVSNSMLTPSAMTITNTTTTTTKSNTPSKTTDTPPTDATVPSPTSTPEVTSSTPSTKTTAPAPTAPPTSETTTPTSTSSAPTTTVTTQIVTTTGIPTEPSAIPIVAAPHTTPTKPALVTTDPGIAVAIAATGLLDIGAILVMRRCQVS